MEFSSNVHSKNHKIEIFIYHITFSIVITTLGVNTIEHLYFFVKRFDVWYTFNVYLNFFLLSSLI